MLCRVLIYVFSFSDIVGMVLQRTGFSLGLQYWVNGRSFLSCGRGKYRGRCGISFLSVENSVVWMKFRGVLRDFVGGGLWR